MTTTAQRLADLERQVTDLAALVEKYARQACTVGTLEEMFFDSRGYDVADFGGARFSLKAASDAGRASARRPRHLHAVEARHA